MKWRGKSSPWLCGWKIQIICIHHWNQTMPARVVYPDLNSLFFTGIFRTHWIKMKSLKILNRSNMEGFIFPKWLLKFQYLLRHFMDKQNVSETCHNLPALHKAAPRGSKIICICMWSHSPGLPLDSGWSHGIRKHRCPTPSCSMAPSSQPSFHYGEGKILFLNGLRFRAIFFFFF